MIHYDHLGNEYKSRKDMCEKYGITVSAYRGRLNKGMSIEDALTTPMRSYKVKDHLGNEFDSINDMCKYYNILPSRYTTRIKEQGMSVKEALTTPKMNGRGDIVSCVKDHLGNEYPSLTDMCNHYNINYGTFYTRFFKHGWSLERALTQKTYIAPSRDHLGNDFDSVENMCKHYGISVGMYYDRLRKGMTIEQALTLKKYHNISECKDHLGNVFPNIKEMAEYWNIRPGKLIQRLKRNDIETALTAPDNYRMLCEDHLGNKFKSVAEMCRYWNITPYRYDGRIKAGWSKEKALMYPVENKEIADGYFVKKHICYGYYECIINDQTVINHYTKIQNDIRKLKQQNQT